MFIQSKLKEVGVDFYHLIILLTMMMLTFQVNADVNSLESYLSQLSQKSYKVKTAAIENIVNSQSPQKQKILQSLLDGDIYFRKSDKKIVFLEKQEDTLKIEDILSGEQFTQKKKTGYKKVTINNRLRVMLRNSIAGIQLSHTDAEVRLSAVSEIMKNLDVEKIELLTKFYQKETDPDVKELMELAISIGELSSDDESVVLAAIKKLNKNLEADVRNKLAQLVEKTESKAIRNAAQAALKSIKSTIANYEMLETLYFGLSLGSVLVLAGIGLAITFGVMGVINMAHGELIMLGAYTTYVVQQLMPDSIGASILVSIPAAFIVAGLVGILMERTVIRHLYGRPLETLLATFGISLILQQAVRSVFSPLNRTVITPEWMSGTLEINSVLALTWNRLYIIVFCLIVFFALLAVMKKTSLGLQVRAVSQNRAMARAMGVRSDWVDALTFGLGAGIAGVAGVALSLLTNVGPNLGQAYIIDSFMVVVFGGVGNLWGTLVAGMSLGVVNKLMEPWAGAVLAKILMLVFIILFIQKRPRGLFPQRGRAAEN